MASYRTIGSIGEKEVIELISCPNCSSKLMLLPTDYPLNDTQCVACNFRAQIKTSKFNPSERKLIPGSGWDIIEKVMKAGFLIPPIIVNYKWNEGLKRKQEIRFYPFIRKSNLKKRIANIESENRIYNMFDYDLAKLPYEVLYQRYI